MVIHIETSVRNAILDTLVDKIDAGAGHGTIEIRTGPQPANANASASGTTLLATLTCKSPAFDNAATGSVSIDATPVLTASAVASGTAAWARVKDGSGNVIFDGTVGTVGTDFVILSTTVLNGQPVSLVSGAISLAG